MQVKNYYKILELPHNASPMDIKKAYRQLAMKYHPDKNSGNQLAEAHFREIQEAYQVLSNPERRSAYNQQRWYRQSTRKHSTPEPITPYTILKRCRQLNHHITRIDTFRINKLALYEYIMHLLSETSVKLLIEWNDNPTNEHI